MKAYKSLETSHRPKPALHDEALAGQVLGLLDANDALERQLIATAKAVPGTWKGLVRETGEEIYRILDKLNGRLEKYTDAIELADAPTKAKLHKHLVKADSDVSAAAKVLPRNPHLETLWSQVDQWTETCLSLASQLTDPAAAEEENALSA